MSPPARSGSVTGMRPFSETIRQRGFILTAEASLSRKTDTGAILDDARILAEHTDAVQLPDNPAARMQVSSLALATELLRSGIEPVVHLTCRDRNRVALQGELLGLGAAGVGSVLLLRGDDLPENHRPRVKEVFELGGRKLIEMARELADDPEVKCVPDFCIGTVATVFNPKAGWKPRSLLAKVEAGARFVQTQLCFDVDALRRYMAHLVEAQLTWKTSVIVSVAVLPGAVSANWLLENLRGSLVPRRVIRRLEQARDPEQEGVAICAELLQQFREVPGVSGAHVMTPGAIETITAAIRASGVKN